MTRCDDRTLSRRILNVHLFDYFGSKYLCSHQSTSRKFNFFNRITLKINLSSDIRYSFFRYMNSVILQNFNYLRLLRMLLLQNDQNTSFQNIIDLFSRYYFEYEMNMSSDRAHSIEPHDIVG